MFTYAFDERAAAGLFLFSGADNDDADFEAYLRAVSELDERALSLHRPVLVQLVDRENAIPDARWRRRIAEATTAIRSKPYYVMVTESAAARGVLTAINWLRPPPFEFEVTSTFESALSLVERKVDRALETTLRRLLDDARRKTRHATAPPISGPRSSR